MILLPCPHCGPRNSTEFRYRGEVHSRPNPSQTDQVAWRSYLWNHANDADWTHELWHHATGCRRFLLLERHTVTNEIRRVAAPGNSGANS
jgi:heterotetrameric sarcosine oxidase delta subunit